LKRDVGKQLIQEKIESVQNAHVNIYICNSVPQLWEDQKGSTSSLTMWYGKHQRGNHQLQGIQ
jgi:hypothetical protein